MRFLLRRLGFYLVAAWASVTLAFVIPRLMPGDPATALFSRFTSRGEDEFANRLLSAMRYEFGGHVETPSAGGSAKVGAR